MCEIPADAVFTKVHLVSSAPTLTIARIPDGRFNDPLQPVVVLHRHHVTLIRVAGNALHLERGRPVADDHDGQNDASDTRLDGFRQRLLLVHSRLSIGDEDRVVRDVFSVSFRPLTTEDVVQSQNTDFV